jgi:two-component system sensor histidine kinase RegB
MLQDLRNPRSAPANRLRLNTLIRLRWLAIVGQSLATC